MSIKAFRVPLGVTATALAFVWATGASATIPYDPFQMDATLTPPGSGAGAITDPLESIGGTNFTATSVYQADHDNLPAPGSTVIDSNIPSILLGLGAPVDYSRQGRTFDSLTFDDSAFDDPGGFTSGAGGDNRWGTIGSGDITRWGLSVDYFLEGTFLGLTDPDPVTENQQPLVNFTAGFFDLYSHNTAWFGNDSDAFGTARDESIQVLRLNLVESEGQVGNIILRGQVNFDFLAGLNSDAERDFARNFFKDSTTGLTYYELVSQGNGAPIIEVVWRLDTNIDTAGNFEDQLINAAEGLRYRTTDLNATIRFETVPIPEPGTLALMGAALLLLGSSIGLGRIRRRHQDHNAAAS